jgi:hypothetical protein
MLECFAVGTEMAKLTIPRKPDPNELIPLRNLNLQSLISKATKKTVCSTNIYLFFFHLFEGTVMVDGSSNVLQEHSYLLKIFPQLFGELGAL